MQRETLHTPNVTKEHCTSMRVATVDVLVLLTSVQAKGEREFCLSKLPDALASVLCKCFFNLKYRPVHYKMCALRCPCFHVGKCICFFSTLCKCSCRLGLCSLVKRVLVLCSFCPVPFAIFSLSLSLLCHSVTFVFSNKLSSRLILSSLYPLFACPFKSRMVTAAAAVATTINNLSATATIYTLYYNLTLTVSMCLVKLHSLVT